MILLMTRGSFESGYVSKASGLSGYMLPASGLLTNLLSAAKVTRTQQHLPCTHYALFVVGNHRNMILELKAETKFSVDENGQTFSVLLDAIYARGLRQPPITMDTVEAILELARKYDVTDVFDFCDHFLSQQQLCDDNFGKIYGMSDTYHLSLSSAHCRKFVVPNFRKLSRQAHRSPL